MMRVQQSRRKDTWESLSFMIDRTVEHFKVLRCHLIELFLGPTHNLPVIRALITTMNFFCREHIQQSWYTSLFFITRANVTTESMPELFTPPHYWSEGPKGSLKHTKMFATLRTKTPGRPWSLQRTGGDARGCAGCWWR
jgi:hypothetical protein